MHPEEDANISTVNDENCTEFVAKLAQIVLRNPIENGTVKNLAGRTRTKSDVFLPKSSSKHSRMHSDPGNLFGGDAVWQEGIEISYLPDRKSAGSPFPSPSMKKKVLKFSESRLTIPPKPSVYISPTSPTRRSNLQFGFTKSSSYSSSDNCDGEIDCGDTIEEKRLFSPDGIEIPQPLNQTRRNSIPPSEPYGTFVGSYEESILTGRLSTTPSKPLPFIAEIGVLATGKCKPQLKCPAHVSLPFHAYFYELDENTPTPYVGTIDLDELKPTFENFGLDDCAGYRLPFKGQLQIMIKNPSRTSIKVFLIPYDFRDMPAGTKTFLRQKSYANSPRFPDRLKFAIHLTFQMTPKRRLYLTNQLRVVFSPRRLEMGEKLKIQYSCPTFPKYAPLEPQKKSISLGPRGLSWLNSGEPPLSNSNMETIQGR